MQPKRPIELKLKAVTGGTSIVGRYTKRLAYVWKGADGGHWWQLDEANVGGGGVIHGPIPHEADAVKAAMDAIPQSFKEH